MKNRDRAASETRHNGSVPGYPDYRFGEGESQEGQRIAVAIGGQEQSTASSSGGPSSDEIAQRAYERYLARDGGDGSPEDDWLAAEEELRRDRKLRLS